MLIATSSGFAGGDMLPVIIVSSLFGVVHRSTKPKGRAVQRTGRLSAHGPSSLSADQSFNFEDLNEAAMSRVSSTADGARITPQNAKVFKGKARLFSHANRTNREKQAQQGDYDHDELQDACRCCIRESDDADVPRVGAMRGLRDVSEQGSPEWWRDTRRENGS